MTKVHIIDGVDYREVKREADVGERVLIVDKQAEHNGRVGEVTFVYKDGISVNIGDDIPYFPYVFMEDYYVLEPVVVESTPSSDDISKSSPQYVTDLIANLARRVAELERINEMQAKENRFMHDNIESAKRDIETWAQDHEAVAFKVVEAEQEIGGLKDEVAELKHANKPAQITLDADVLARLLGGVARD